MDNMNDLIAAIVDVEPKRKDNIENVWISLVKVIIIASFFL